MTPVMYYYVAFRARRTPAVYISLNTGQQYQATRQSSVLKFITFHWVIKNCLENHLPVAFALPIHCCFFTYRSDLFANFVTSRSCCRCVKKWVEVLLALVYQFPPPQSSLSGQHRHDRPNDNSCFTSTQIRNASITRHWLLAFFWHTRSCCFVSLSLTNDI